MLEKPAVMALHDTNGWNDGWANGRRTRPLRAAASPPVLTISAINGAAEYLFGGLQASEALSGRM